MPDPQKLLNTLDKAIDLTQNTPGRKGLLIHLNSGSDILVSGDLHGHIGNFQKIFSQSQLTKETQRHFVLQEVVHGNFYYPQGGDKSHQLLDLYAALKCQFPARVHLLMGNHELSQWQNRLIMKNDRDLNQCFYDGVMQGYGNYGETIYQKYMDLIAILPVAIRTANRLWISHSLPATKYISTFSQAELEKETITESQYQLGGEVFAMVWGRNTLEAHVQQFLRLVDADWLITGHIPCEQGYNFPNRYQVIVDCSQSPAAYALLPLQSEIVPEIFEQSIHPF